jgi:hypothetical protein
MSDTGNATRAKYMREWRAGNLEKAREISRIASRKWDSDNREQKKVIRSKYYHRLRDAIMAFFGPVCVACGFSDVRALEIDHILGNGATEKRTVYRDGTKYIYDLIRTDPNDARRRYQVLCRNCNVIKKIEREEHLPKRDE